MNRTKFQFRLRGLAMGREHDRWEDAAADACRMGYADWIRYPRVIHTIGDAAVVRLKGFSNEPS